MFEHSDRPFPAAALVAIAVLAVLAAAAAPAGSDDTERERVPGRDLTRRQADSMIDPNDDSNGRLLRDHADRLGTPPRLDPAIAWTPGGPDGGGGSGEPWEPESEGPRYDLELLPLPAGHVGSPKIDSLSENRRWIGGYTRAHNGCTNAQAATLWERDATVLVHLLPAADGGNAEGLVEAVLGDGTAVGYDHTYLPDCGLGPIQPLLWEPIGAGVWAATELPTAPAEGGLANDAAIVGAAGLVIVGETTDAALWRQVAGSWVMEALGNLGGRSTAQAINASGVVVGYSQTGPGTANVGFRILPEDADGDGTLDTWFRDSDGDGLNDLMQALGDGGASLALSINATWLSCGEGLGGATIWESLGVSGTAAITLPAGSFTDGTNAFDVSGAHQVVGEGRSADGRGVEVRGALWERDLEGAWRVLALDDVTEAPTGATIVKAHAVNSCGDVAVSVNTADGRMAALLKPRSSPCD